MMSFYTHMYLEGRIYFQDYIKFIVIFVTLIALLAATSYYLRHRLETKYRDLSIFMLGVQYNNYQQSQVYAADTSRMVSFLNSVIENQNIRPQDIIVNRQNLMNGMIIGIQSKYYEVHFNSDFSAYTLSPINLVNPNIQLVDK